MEKAIKQQEALLQVIQTCWDDAQSETHIQDLELIRDVLTAQIKYNEKQQRFFDDEPEGKLRSPLHEGWSLYCGQGCPDTKRYKVKFFRGQTYIKERDNA